MDPLPPMDQITSPSNSQLPSTPNLPTPRLTRRARRKRQIHQLAQGAGFRREEMKEIEPTIRQQFPEKLAHYQMILDPEEATPGMIIRYVDFQYETVRTGLLIKHLRDRRGKLQQYQLHNLCYHSTWQIVPQRYWIFCRRPNSQTSDLRKMLQKMLAKYGLDSLSQKVEASDIVSKSAPVDSADPPDPELLAWIKEVQQQYAETQPRIRKTPESQKKVKSRKTPVKSPDKKAPKRKPKVEPELPPVDLQRPEKEEPAVLTFNQLADW